MLSWSYNRYKVCRILKKQVIFFSLTQMLVILAQKTISALKGSTRVDPGVIIEWGAKLMRTAQVKYVDNFFKKLTTMIGTLFFLGQYPLTLIKKNY